METSKKNIYVPPSMEVHPVALEANIALQSPIQKIEMEDWVEEGEVKPDTGDIYLAI